MSMWRKENRTFNKILCWISCWACKWVLTNWSQLERKDMQRWRWVSRVRRLLHVTGGYAGGLKPVDFCPRYLLLSDQDTDPFVRADVRFSGTRCSGLGRAPTELLAKHFQTVAMAKWLQRTPRNVCVCVLRVCVVNSPLESACLCPWDVAIREEQTARVIFQVMQEGNFQTDQRKFQNSK